MNMKIRNVTMEFEGATASFKRIDEHEDEVAVVVDKMDITDDCKDIILVSKEMLMTMFLVAGVIKDVDSLDFEVYFTIIPENQDEMFTVMAHSDAPFGTIALEAITLEESFCEQMTINTTTKEVTFVIYENSGAIRKTKQ